MLEFRLPSLGADMDEGTLVEWQIRPGDTVTKGQVVAVVETAKAAIDVECWLDGTVHELLLRPGEKVPVGTVIATLLAPGEEAPPTAPIRSTERRRVSPAAHRRAVPHRHRDLPAPGRARGAGHP